MPANNAKQSGRVGKRSKNKRSSRRSGNKGKNKRNSPIVIQPKAKNSKKNEKPAIRVEEERSIENFLGRINKNFFDEPFFDDDISEISCSDSDSFYLSEPESVILGFKI